MNAKERNKKLDAQVLEAIRDSPLGRPVTALSLEKLANEETGTGLAFRQIDRALQRLRKAGKIRFHTRLGWVATE
jgi:hypothetical protein